MTESTTAKLELDLSIPSPIIHKRNRTSSQSERAALGEHGRGTIEFFCRTKGHGFISPDDGSEHVFVHVFDVEGEFVPHKGDVVEYRKIKVPPKCEKWQAVHVKLVNFAPGKHETWNERPHLGEIPESN